MTARIPDPLAPGATIAVNDFIASAFGIERGGGGGASGVFPGQWGAVGMLGALCAAYFVASYLSLRFLRHQRR